MVSQMLFGEMADVLEKKDGWLRVSALFDGTEGWVDAKQFRPITPSEKADFAENHAISLALVEGAMAADHFLPITLGATLPAFDGIRFTLGDAAFSFSGQTIFPKTVAATGELIQKIAKKYLHAPEFRGGRSPFGIDSSGLVQMVYKMAGIRLLRDAEQQAAQGRLVDFMQETQVGDIAFFDDQKGRIIHCGLILEGSKILHVWGRARLDSVDHFGIFNAELNKYSHQLRIVKRHFADAEKVILTKNASILEEEAAVPQPALFEL